MQTTRLVFKRQADWRLLNDVVDKLDQVLYYRDEIHERERAKAEKSGVASEDQPPRDLSQDAIAQFVFQYQIVTQIEGNTPEQEEILVRAISIEEVPEEDRHCGICRITMGVPDEGAEARIERPVITGCKHVFGDLCLKQWASEREEPDCPLCRKRIEFPKVMPTIDQRIEADITLEENITTCIELFPLREILDAGNYTRFDYILTEKKLARDIQAMILTVGLPEKSDEGGEAR
ncbi:hypothetical protein M7I_0683 [Glarea lozoyensis 74030]|uniref:RING-type domain-containing protein n=1 Tax=Glarea lozoyensis (strain ATCC 74030 / MF5533) TaxID=1104152 RepID=H0EE15_GLAL7|nr:hypothetical protein M7I_0683 [Glarea lozoyensis 74030]